VAIEGRAEDGDGFPPPEERSWRHPSEFGSARPTRPVSLVTSAPQGPSGGGRGHTVAVSLLSALVGSIITLAAITVAGGFNKQAPEAAGVERHTVDPAKTPLSPVEIAEKVVPSVGRIDVTGPRGPRAGTAVVFRSNAQAAYLLTTSDLLDGAEKISVTTADGSSLPAQFVGRDPYSEIGVVKVDAPNLPPVVLGRPASKLQLGDPVLAVESSPTTSPARGANTVPVGVVNGLGERLTSDDQNKTLYGMVKTNLRLTSEATGTPLIDATNGSVIGIITSRGYRAPGPPGEVPVTDGVHGRDATGDAPGADNQTIVRFATPIDYANTVADQLIREGRVPYAWLGVTGNALTDDEAKRLGVKGGYRLANVNDQSPASEAGLRVDDVLLSLDDTDISSLDDLAIALREHPPGDYVTLYYLRNGERQPTYATLTERNPGG